MIFIQKNHDRDGLGSVGEKLVNEGSILIAKEDADFVMTFKKLADCGYCSARIAAPGFGNDKNFSFEVFLLQGFQLLLFLSEGFQGAFHPLQPQVIVFLHFFISLISWMAYSFFGHLHIFVEGDGFLPICFHCITVFLILYPHPTCYQKVLNLLISIKSARTNAARFSTMGTARGTTQASCRPLPSSVTGWPSLSTLGCGRSRVATGLNATRKYTSIPLEIPPCMPPERLVLVVKSGLKISLCSA